MQEESKVYRIPVNYAQGVTVLGTIFPVRNLAEAVVCCVLLSAAELSLLRGRGLTTLLSALICTAILCSAVILPGLDGGSFFSFVRLFLRFRLRTAKREKTPPSRPAGSPKKKALKKKTVTAKRRDSAAEDPQAEDIWEDLVIPMRHDEN